MCLRFGTYTPMTRSGKTKTVRGLSRKSDTAAAIRYALSRWRALGRYLDDGSIEIR
jgi:hypothetical protein